MALDSAINLFQWDRVATILVTIFVVVVIAEVVVTQPRMPCFKLNVRFQRPDMVKRFLRSGRTGFYLAVLKEGQVGAGDGIDLVPTDERR